MQSATAPERGPGLGAAASGEGFHLLRLGAATLGHAANDAYLGLLYPLIPLLVVKHGISIALTGLLISAFNATGALSQPLFGFYADKVRKRSFVVAGPVVTGLFVGAAGLAPSYSVLLVLMLLGGLGSGCFHPAGVTMAGMASARRRGLGLAVFVAGGRLGVAVGSALATFLVARWGLEGSAWAVLLALAAGGLLWATAPPMGAPPPGQGGDLRGALANMGKAGWPLFTLGVISILRTTVSVGMGAYLPLFFVERGASFTVAGGSVSVFLFAGALGGILGGHLSDVFGRRSVIFASLAVAFPALALFFVSPGLWKLPWLILSGALIFTSMSVIVAMGQEMLPSNAALSAGLMLGAAWFCASLAVTGIGGLADWAGLAPTLAVAFPLAAGLAAVLTLALPREEVVRRAARGVAS